MDNKEHILQNFKKELRSLLIPSKYGLSIQELEQDYRMLIGSNLPVKKLEYRSVMDMLHDMPDVVKMYTKVDGTVILSAVVNDETRGIANLVSKQKTASKRKSLNRRRVSRPLYSADLVRRGRIAPILPASVKSDLRDLLSISPLLISQLESAFYKRFGRSFQYARYGFYSLIEVLRAVSDIVQVKQTSTGSLLVLKTSEIMSTFIGASAKTVNIQSFNPVPPVKLNRPYNVPSDDAQYSKRDPYIEAIPLPAVPTAAVSSPCTGPTPLDKLFMAAEVQYYANQQSLQVNMVPNEPFEARDTGAMCKDAENAADPQCLLHTAITQDPNNNNVLVQSPVETITAATTVLNADNAEPSKDCNLQELVDKLDKDLKLSLSMKKAGSVIGPELQREIKHVVQKYPEGLSISKLPVLYKEHTGKGLPFRELGLMSVLDLVGSLSDMLHLENTMDGRDWRVFDIETKDRKLLHIDQVSRSNLSVEESDCLKPLLIVSPAEGNKLWTHLNLKLSCQDIPPDAVRKQKLHSLPRMKRGFIIGVFVENIISPSEFCVRCYSKDTSRKLEDMMMEMRRCYSNEYVSDRYTVPDDFVSVGEIYALCVAGDVWWYRVIVHSVICSEDVQVYYPDFGNVASVKKHWLRFLKNCYMKLPAQALPSSLAFVTPVEDQWSTEAIRLFQRYCARGPVVGIVLQYVLDQLYLFLCDTSTDDDIYLHQLLINHKLGKLVQEPGFYKDSQMRNVFVQYLIQSSEPPQEESIEISGKIETSIAEIENDKEAETQIKEETELDMPYLEAVPDGDDVWDESWSLSGHPVCNTIKPSFNDADQHRLEKCSPEPVNGGVQNTDADCLPHPLEDFYISLIKSKNSLEAPAELNSPPSKQCLVDDMDIPKPTNDHSKPIIAEQENQSLEKNELVCHKLPCDDQAAKGGSPLLGFQRFQIRRSATTAALGSAARLAASPGNLLHWVTVPGQI